MKNRAAVAVIITATFVIWMGIRATGIALPLVALRQTGHVWATGLVLGAQSIPLVTVPWWGRRLRERMTTGPAIAAALAVQAAGLAVVPVAAYAGRLGVVTLCAAGLVVGAASALEAPGIRALLSDLGDHIGPGSTPRYLALQDLAHRAPMFLAPPLGALAVGHGHTMPLLWAECAAVALAAVAIAFVRVPAPAHVGAASGAPAASILAVLRRHRRLAASITVTATISVTWFAFSLGLAVLGEQVGRPGALVAAGMTGYGIASTAASFVAPWLVNRLPAWPTAVLPAAVLGVAYAAMPLVSGSTLGLALVAAAGGVTMPLGIAAHNRLLSGDTAEGPERRAAFTGDAVAGGVSTALGNLAGGAVLGLAGVPATLVAAGVLLAAATGVALAVAPGRRAAAPDPGRQSSQTRASARSFSS